MNLNKNLGRKKSKKPRVFRFHKQQEREAMGSQSELSPKRNYF
jgi:hypothetical protein